MEKAYKNLDFLNSREARGIRILSEYVEPQARFAHYNVRDTVVFFGSARAQEPDVAEAALEEARRGPTRARSSRRVAPCAWPATTRTPKRWPTA